MLASLCPLNTDLFFSGSVRESRALSLPVTDSMIFHHIPFPLQNNASVRNISELMPLSISLFTTSDCSLTATRKHLVSIWRNGLEVIQFF